MRAAAFAFVAVTLSLAAFAACGGSSPPSQTPVGVAVAVSAPDAAPPSTGDPGPTTTTTATLGATGPATGVKLTAAASGDGGAPHVKHQAELGRSIADIQAIMSSHRDEARACYDNALSNHPGIEGTIDIRWTIDPKGTVADAEVDSSHTEILEPSVGTCIVAMIKKIHFNASAKGFETKAHYPFNFHPRGKHVVGSATQ
jgi:outer membrane biosynthesis protein TonB